MIKNDLVHTQSNEVFTTSEIVAKELEVKHLDLLRTVKNIISHENFTFVKGAGQHPVFINGTQKFMKIILKNRMGREYDGYSMNESAFFKLIMQLSKYKKANLVQDMFIDAFAGMKKVLLQHQNASWLDTREKGKTARLEETNTIQEFVEYAKGQGSTNAGFYYGNLTKATYKALELMDNNKATKIKDIINGIELGFVMAAEMKVVQALKEGMEKEMHYKEIYMFAKQELEKLAAVLPIRQVKLLNS